MPKYPESKKYYEAPIMLGFTPSDGDLIRGTINGVEVSGQWTKLSNGAILYDESNTSVPFCAIVFRGAKTVVSVQQDSAPTTDYELHLYRYVPASIVQIPQEYVDGLEATTANANEALETATAAQSTADTAKSTATAAKSTADAAKSTADTAKSTADAIKPDWNEMSTTSPKYIANRPCYHANTEIEIGESISHSEVLIEGTQLYWHGSFEPTTEAPSVSYGEKYRIGEDTQIYECNGYRTAAFQYYDIIGNAALVSDHLELVSDGSGNPIPDTGEDWAYVTYRTSQTSSMFAKTQDYKLYNFLYKITENLKTLDPILIPSEIQRVGDDVIINSSTPDSTKKFKITVDDTGTISATEVS